MIMHAPRDVYLETCLAPIAAHLERADVTDIYINKPGEVWIETLSAGPVQIDAPALTDRLLARLARQIAALSAQGINRENPLLAASLPTGERVQIAMPPATRGHIAFAIRKHVLSEMKLQDYSDAGAFEHTLTDPIPAISKIAEIGDAEEPIALLRSAMKSRCNILISGGTSSGKTTLLNALLREIGAEERLIFIEDTPELRIDHPNAVGLLVARGHLGEAQITAEDLLVAALRMRPDRIILGEIRGSEAVTFLRALNTGHPGSLSTIHADSPSRAIDQMALLVTQAGTRMAWDDVVAYVRRSIDLIVQLERPGGSRRIGQLARIIN
jgi:type IV secretion system protein VirB11